MKIYIGIDWSEKQHSVRVLNEAGAEVLAIEVEATLDGYAQLQQRLQLLSPQVSNCFIGIETSENPLVDFLLMAGYPLYVLPPTMVSSNRGRQGAARAKDDGRDALLLADIVRTDRGRLQRWQPNSVLVRQLQLLLSEIDDLTESILQQHNRLRANLLRYYPQAAAAFAPLHRTVQLRFLEEHPQPLALSLSDFQQRWRALGGRVTVKLAERWQQLQQPQPTLPPELMAVCAERSVRLAGQLLDLNAQKEALISTAYGLFLQHPDAPIYQSIPGAGKLLQPKLLAMMGDERNRYPSPDVLAAIAGTAPVTVRSGQSGYVKFRRACNKRLRTNMQQLAKSSLRYSAYSADYFYGLKARGHYHSHALRCLANRWVRIIWVLWQRRQPYDEALHMRDVIRRRQPLAA